MTLLLVNGEIALTVSCIFFNTLLVKRVHFLCDIHAVQSQQ